VPGAYNLQDVEQMRIVLNGTSVIDWRRLAFTRHDQIDDFLRVSGFELDDATDRLQLDSVHRRALDYLTRNFGVKLHPGVVDLDDLRDLFLLASQPAPRSGMRAASSR
jgi:uncharacterized protein (TIGR04552 family)